MEHIAQIQDIEQLSEAILCAVEAAEVGFHFEEGGCWGFAAALHDIFAERGLHPRIQVQHEGFVHAWVEAGGQSWDHQGVMEAKAREMTPATRQELMTVAATHGVNEEQFLADVYLAKDILAELP